MPKVFLYGPDTFRSRVLDRIGPATVDGTGILAGYRLRFDKPNRKRETEGLANISPSEKDVVYGVIFDMTRKQIELIEGYFGGYSPQDVEVTLRDQRKIPATTFIARRTQDGLTPSRSTVDMSIRGAEENSLPRDYVDSLRALKVIDD